MNGILKLSAENEEDICLLFEALNKEDSLLSTRGRDLSCTRDASRCVESIEGDGNGEWR